MGPLQFSSSSSTITIGIGTAIGALQYLHIVQVLPKRIGAVQLATVATKHKYLPVGDGKDRNSRKVPALRTPAAAATIATHGRLAPGQGRAIQNVQIVELLRGAPPTHDVEIAVDGHRLMAGPRGRVAARRVDVVPLPRRKAEGVDVGKVLPGVARASISSKDNEYLVVIGVGTAHYRCRVRSSRRRRSSPGTALPNTLWIMAAILIGSSSSITYGRPAISGSVEDPNVVEMLLVLGPSETSKDNDAGVIEPIGGMVPTG